MTSIHWSNKSYSGKFLSITRLEQCTFVDKHIKSQTTCITAGHDGPGIIGTVNGIMGYRQLNDKYTFWNVFRHILLLPNPSFVLLACLVIWHAIITRFLMTVPIRRLFTGGFMGWFGPMLLSPIIRRML